jgi:hypothetical protein
VFVCWVCVLGFVCVCVCVFGFLFLGFGFWVFVFFGPLRFRMIWGVGEVAVERCRVRTIYLGNGMI